MRLRSAGIALALAALPALSQTSAATFGLKTGFAFPGGDMTNYVGSDSALSLGLQVRIDLHRGHALMPWLEQVTFKGDTMVDTYSFGPLPVHAEQKITSLGLDYNYFTSGRTNDGFYFSVGLGFLQKEDSYTAPAGYTFTQDPNESKSRVFGALGLGGVIAHHVDLSLRWQFFGDEKTGTVYYSNGSQSDTYSNSTVLTLGVAYHF